MIDMSTIMPIVLIFGLLIAFKDWDEIEIKGQAIECRIKRRKAEYLRSNNIDTLSEKSSPIQLPKE
jgi:hypothetical protein